MKCSLNECHYDLRLLRTAHSPLSRIALLSILLIALLQLGTVTQSRAQVAVLTQHNNNARTGANLNETTLKPSNVNVNTFGKLFTYQMDADVNGQVLYVPNVTIQGVTRNVIYAYTSNNSNGSSCSLYAFDADNPNAPNPLWRHQFTNSAQWTTCTPVIDPSTNTIFVLTKDNNDSGPTRLRALDITTGNEKTGSPILIAATVNGTGDGSSGGKVSFDTTHANCRPGLLLLPDPTNSSAVDIYIAFSHNSDSFPYHGWIFGYSYDQTQFTQKAVFCSNPNGGEDGIWMAGKGLAADANGHIYAATGNGTFDINTGGTSYGMCYLKLSTPNLTVLDWFSPSDEKGLSDQDLDLAGAGVLLIPGTNRIFGGGTKYGSVYLLNSTNMGKFTSGGPDNIVQELNNVTPDDSVGQNGICWNTGTIKYVYLWASGANLQAFKYDPTVGKFNPAGAFSQNSNTNGGSLTVTSHGGSNGILWAVGNDNIFHAYNAADLTTELWNSNQNSSRDGINSVGHFQFPTVVNGKAYVPTGSAQIAVYGLLPIARINCYGPAVGAFSKDIDFSKPSSGGTTTHTIDLSGVTNPAPQSVYQSWRAGTNHTNLVYTIPNLIPGNSYTVRLHFAENRFAKAGQRVFNVQINGSQVLTNFDIFKTAGAQYKAVVEQFTATANSSGQIVLTFAYGSAGNPIINGIEVF